MAPERTKDRVKRWFARIDQANKAHSKWAKDFKVEKSKRYWKGLQRQGDDQFDERHNERVTVNLIGPSVAIKIPSLYFYYPFARVTAAPGKSETAGEHLDEKAQLLQDTANAIVRDQNTGFRFETLLALKESMWSYGVIEIGYSAEFIDNPAFKRPPLAEDEDTRKDMEGSLGAAPPVNTFGDPSLTPPPPAQPGSPPLAPLPEQETDPVQGLKKLVDKESFYVRRIPAESFRCSISGKPTLLSNDWIGYYEWMYVEDVKQSPAYRNTKDIKSSGKISDDLQSNITMYDETPSEEWAEDKPSRRDRSGMVRIWKIWSLREKTRYVFAEGLNDKILLEEEYKVLPLYILRFEEQTDDFYPVPPIFPMLGPQDEYNDGREMLRGLRKTIHARYTWDETIIDPDELAKLENGGAGVMAKARHSQGEPIKAVNQPTHDSSVVRTLVVSKDDLLQVSGIPGEARGQAESDTATQAEIINQRLTTRENFGRLKVAEWLGQIIRGLIQLAINKMTLPMWILRNVDPFAEGFQMEALKIGQAYKEITFQDLKEADSSLRWDVSVDIESLSPLTELTARQQWTQALSLMSNPAMATLLAASPELLKKTLDVFGMRSSKDQSTIAGALQAVAQMAAMGQMKQQGSPPAPPSPGQSRTVGPPGQPAMSAGTPPPNAAQGTPPPGPPPGPTQPAGGHQ